MKILRKKDVPRRENKKEIRYYYLLKENEIIVTELPAHHEQPWHTHKLIQETHYVMQGQIEVIEEGTKSFRASEGDIIILQPGKSHSVKNPSHSPAHIVTLKTVPTNRNYKKVFSEDKSLD